MGKFDHVAATKVIVKARPFELDIRFRFPDGTWSERPVLWMYPATKENAAYWSARQRGVRRGVARQEDLTPEIEESIRVEDCELFSKFVVEKWERVQAWDDGIGAPVEVPFSQTDCHDFLLALAPDLFMSEVQGPAMTRDSFRLFNVEAAAKNS